MFLIVRGCFNADNLFCLGNRAHPADGKPLFAEGDSRLQFTVSDVDPRIHFALVCGAKVQ